MLHELRTRPLFEHLLRGAVAFSFLYPPFSALTDAATWIGYIPLWISDLAPVTDTTLLHIFGAVEVGIALWLLLGRDVRIPATLAAGILLFITATNANQFSILFRDAALALAALALVFIPRTHAPTPTE